MVHKPVTLGREAVTRTAADRLTRSVLLKVWSVSMIM
jgi:hypothetical protein